jgi:hypothetical protein
VHAHVLQVLHAHVLQVNLTAVAKPLPSTVDPMDGCVSRGERRSSEPGVTGRTERVSLSPSDRHVAARGA